MAVDKRRVRIDSVSELMSIGSSIKVPRKIAPEVDGSRKV